LSIAVVAYQMGMILMKTNTIFTITMNVNMVIGCRLILVMGRC